MGKGAGRKGKENRSRTRAAGRRTRAARKKTKTAGEKAAVKRRLCNVVFAAAIVVCFIACKWCPVDVSKVSETPGRDVPKF